MLKVFSRTVVILFLFLRWCPEVLAQPVLPDNLKKPKKFENRKLGAEKSAEKKFKGPRRFIQNTVTHYNWFYNANNKLDQVIERAKLAHQEDYSRLLPFYNYSLEKTAADKTELDSVIYKANAGILNHDLRNAWIDNLFMLMGRAYYLRNNFDSAYMTFQYINYAFSPKEKDGYDMPIGSNANEGTSVLSVSTKENNGLVKRALSTPPSRNEALVWQIKTYLAAGQMPEAASLIQTLKNDPQFPERLSSDLHEVQALWFYKQDRYDSAAIYLEQALDKASGRQERSRWEFLIGQLYALAHKPDLSQTFFARARQHTLDPVMEVYAILNGIRQNRSDSGAIRKNIEALKRMGRKERYLRYRDVIYYTAAQIELERNNIDGAKQMLLKSTAASADNLNPAQRTRSFLLLGDLSYQQKLYPDAKRYYDSVNNNDPGLADVIAFDQRKQALQLIVTEMLVLQRQDSLQRLAALPEAEREALLKKMVRQLRKKQGLREDEPAGNAAVGLNASNNSAVPDLFGADQKGDWYFNNPALKSRGFTAFRQTWGNRPNVDNWRRQAAITQANTALRDNQPKIGPDGQPAPEEMPMGSSLYDYLVKDIPLTPKQMEASQDSLSNALANLGILYIDKLEEYPMAIDTLENLVDKYPYSSRVPEALYYLYNAYRKTGNTAGMQQARQLLDQHHSDSRYQKLIANAVSGAGDSVKREVTQEYEAIYNLFIEGSFEEALHKKQLSDSAYGSTYWTPQLLYIESVYYLQARRDDEARKALQNIIDLYPDEPIADKAKNILEVLSHRKEIEDYLTQLQITREDDSVVVANALQSQPAAQVGTPMQQDSTTLQPLKQSLADSLAKVQAQQKPEVTAPQPVIKEDTVKEVPSSFSFNVEAPHMVVILMNKVDPVYVSESRNAFNRYNQEKFYNVPIEISNLPFNDSLKMVVMSGFSNAAVAREYLQKTQPVAATQIVPWLPAGKYSFMLISVTNLEVLQNNQDLESYRTFEKRYFK